MKKIFISLLATAALAGCSGNEENLAIDDGRRVPIELNAGVNTLSRAVISSGSDISNIGIAGWEAKENAADYTAKYTWHTHLSTTASTSAHNVTWLAQQYYNADETLYTHMKAWYPCGDFVTSPIENNKVTFSNDGTVDVMMADVVKGNKILGVSGPLQFKHKTSQIKFKVKKGTGLTDGTKIQKIVIKDAQLPTGFDISKPYIDADVITYAEAADLLIPNLNSNQVIGDEASAGDPVMIRPTGTNDFLIDVTTSGATYTDCKVTLTSGAKMNEGYAYTITLTFGQAGLELTAIVDEWKSATGGAELQ